MLIAQLTDSLLVVGFQVVDLNRQLAPKMGKKCFGNELAFSRSKIQELRRRSLPGVNICANILKIAIVNPEKSALL